MCKTTTDDLEHAFARGLAMARDPQNAHLLDDPHAPRVTTIYSAWYRTVCALCRHTFREEDRVLPHPTRKGSMVHEDPHMALCCWSRLLGQHVDAAYLSTIHAQVRAQFLQGLNTHWHPDPHVQQIIVEPESPFIRRRCPVCRHTIRIGDTVVVCPCGRDGCHGVFHQDITRHLTCWDTWSRGGNRPYCAFTGAPFQSEEETRCV
jgi:hypothetical protein